jgi:cytochrome c-type biogenesis protein CcmE
MKRGRLVFAVAAVGASLGWVAFTGLKGNLVYYKTPTEILQQGTSGEGLRVRLGGQVQSGSVQRSGSTVSFIVTDGTTRMTVIDTAGVPSLFRDGKGVVVEGYYGADGTFHADTVLVKHNDDYRPPSPGETPHSADVEGGG